MPTTSTQAEDDAQEQKQGSTNPTNIPPSNHKRSKDVFGSLYDDKSASSEHGQASSPTTSSSTAPTQQHIVEVIKTLYDSIKVVAVTDCPVHPGRAFCDCPAGVNCLRASDINHCKSNIFMRYWDIKLLGGSQHAFNYTGDQASHDTFVGTEGKTPREFAKAFMKSAPISELFATSGRLNDTIQAMVKYWIVRNAQWKAKYITREEAHKKWLFDAYDMSDMKKISREDLMEDMDSKWEVGEAIPTFECKYGPPGHECMVVLMPCGTVGGSATMKILDIKRCHAPCAVVDAHENELVEQAVRGCISQYYGQDIPAGELQTFGTVQELKEFAKSRGDSGGGEH